MNMFLKYGLVQTAVVALLMGNVLNANGQVNSEKETEHMIGASRGAASPLVFSVNNENIAVIDTGIFSNAKETLVRDGLGNFFSKLQQNRPVTIGYIGGSITQAFYGYRLQSAKYIQSLYPDVKMQFLNAGVSGTGTDLGACRLKDQILTHHPDLIFIEFAVNGAYQDGMEGMIRQIIRDNPKTDICLIYTLISGQAKGYTEGFVPENIQGLEEIAEYYHIPSIHLGMEAAALEKAGKLIWKGEPKSAADQIVFSADGVHPTTEGGNIYAAAIARGINKMKIHSMASNHILPKPLCPSNWDDAKMIDPLEVAKFSAGWTKILTSENAQLRQFKGWFPYVMYTEKTGSSFTFKFTGTMVGFYDLGGPEVGEVSIELDGKPVMLQEVYIKGYHYYKVLPAGSNGASVINRFNNYCNNRYRGQYEFLETGPGKHTVTVVLSSLKANKAMILGKNQQEDISINPAKYDRTALYLGKILLKGDLVKE